MAERMPPGDLHLLSAFTTTPEGGNPAGVWMGDELPDRAEMQRIAREVGFSETAFVAPTVGRRRSVRYYSPEAEVPFCGHATIAAGVTSVEPRHHLTPPDLLDNALAALRWRAAEVDPSIPSAVAFAGAWHLVIAAGREQPAVFHTRDPFPVGGVVEDPATGAAAAALGGYLRDAKLIDASATILIRQGEAMGRPSRLLVRIPAAGGIVVSGHAVGLRG